MYRVGPYSLIMIMLSDMVIFLKAEDRMIIVDDGLLFMWLVISYITASIDTKLVVIFIPLDTTTLVLV